MKQQLKWLPLRLFGYINKVCIPISRNNLSICTIGAVQTAFFN